VEEVGHQPGVLAAGVITRVPVRSKESGQDKRLMTVVGYTPRPGEPPGVHFTYGIAGDYFATMGIRLREGRFLGNADLRLLLAGTLLGMVGAWLAGRAMQSILFNVPALHLATLLGTALILGVVSLASWLVPAVRASRMNPMEALRDE
jgi:uncharacterized membrane protein YeaQ/YmgE (transglycosylase-associated protein family)